MEREIHLLLPKGERAIGGEIDGALGGVVPTLPLRRRPLMKLPISFVAQPPPIQAGDDGVL